VAFEGIGDRDAAEALKGAEALIDRAELPALEADEIYAADFVGLTVLDEQGHERGQVVDFESAGPNDLLHVKVDANVFLVPVGLIRSVDLDAKRVTIEAPDGLFSTE
jgi:16S rRNA processing protein RimM